MKVLHFYHPQNELQSRYVSLLTESMGRNVESVALTTLPEVKSALSQQTTFKYNVFVVENGPECHSTDGTTEAIDDIDDDRLVHIVPDRNDIGVGGAWNMALHHPLCGRFLVQLDSDDVYSGPDSLLISSADQE